jgi:hypothetical protein
MPPGFQRSALVAQAASSVTMCWELAFFPPGDTLSAEALDIHPAGTKSMTTGDVIDYIHLSVKG